MTPDDLAASQPDAPGRAAHDQLAELLDDLWVVTGDAEQTAEEMLLNDYLDERDELNRLLDELVPGCEPVADRRDLAMRTAQLLRDGHLKRPELVEHVLPEEPLVRSESDGLDF